MVANAWLAFEFYLRRNHDETPPPAKRLAAVRQNVAEGHVRRLHRGKCGQYLPELGLARLGYDQGRPALRFTTAGANRKQPNGTPVAGRQQLCCQASRHNHTML
jgi:hypothetical protein